MLLKYLIHYKTKHSIIKSVSYSLTTLQKHKKHWGKNLNKCIAWKVVCNFSKMSSATDRRHFVLEISYWRTT